MLMYRFLFSKTFCRLLVAYLASMLLFDLAGADIWLASKFYQLEGYQWALRDYWLTEDVLHKGARKLNYMFALAVLLTTFYYHRLDKTQPKLRKAYLT